MQRGSQCGGSCAASPAAKKAWRTLLIRLAAARMGVDAAENIEPSRDCLEAVAGVPWAAIAAEPLALGPTLGVGRA